MIKRNAIIISCPGENDNYLPGAVKDVENMVNYLCSPKGGNFKRNEIICLRDTTWELAEWHIDKSSADYQIIYFTGHGCTQNNQRLLAFKDILVPDIWLLNNNPKQLIIVDACRNYLATIGEIPQAEDVYSNFSGVSEARLAFDYYIQNSPIGKMIIHSTHNGAVANDISSKGGAFSYTLLETTMKLKTNTDFSPVFIDQLLPTVRKKLLDSGYNQFPCISYSSGNLRIPFRTCLNFF